MSQRVLIFSVLKKKDVCICRRKFPVIMSLWSGSCSSRNSYTKSFMFVWKRAWTRPSPAMILSKNPNCAVSDHLLVASFSSPLELMMESSDLEQGQFVLLRFGAVQTLIVGTRLSPKLGGFVFCKKYSLDWIVYVNYVNLKLRNQIRGEAFTVDVTLTAS